MPDPAVRLDTTRLSASPGGQVSVVVTIRNMGQIVEGYTVEALGEAAPWATLPDEVPVYPQQEATVVVVFSVPDGVGAASGLIPFGLLVRSVVDPEGSAVVEGDLDVAAVVGLQPVLRPVTSKGRWRGRHEIRVTNWGNAPVRLRLSASDPDERLAFLLHPDVLDVPLGGTGRARLSVRTRQPFLRGTPTRLPFQVVADSRPPGSTPPTALGGYDPGRLTVDGALNQVPILSKLVVTAAILLGVASVGGVVYALSHPSKDTNVFASSTDLARPQLEAQSGSDSIKLLWEPVDGATGYQVVTIDPSTNLANKTDPVDKGLQQFDVAGLAPGSKHCYKLVALQGAKSSESAPVCKSTTAGTTPTTPAGSDGSNGGTAGSTSGGGSGGSSGGSGGVGANPAGGPAATEWIIEYYVRPLVGNPQAEAQAKALVKELQAQNLQAKYLLSSAYPKWTPNPLQNESYVVYVGGFKTAQDAAAAPCKKPPNEAVAPDCQVVQPGPAS
jgi:hypothetical protein